MKKVFLSLISALCLIVIIIPNYIQKPVNICFATDNKYSEATLVSIYSIYKNKHLNYKINFYIIADKMSENNKERFKHLINSQKDNLFFIDIDSNKILPEVKLHAEIDSKLKHVSRICLSKIIISQLLPKNVEKILVLDSDLLFLNDVRYLYNKNLGKNIVAMAYDIHGIGNIKYNDDDDKMFFSNWMVEKFPLKEYFNGGVILIDLKEWRKQNIEEKMIDMFYKYKDKNNVSMFYFNEQDIYNAVLNEKIKKLPLAWNIPFDHFNSNIKNCKKCYLYIGARNVYHFEGNIKPWTKYLDCNLEDMIYLKQMKEHLVYKLFNQNREELLKFENEKISPEIKPNNITLFDFINNFILEKFDITEHPEKYKKNIILKLYLMF